MWQPAVASSNRAALDVAAGLATDGGAAVEAFDRLAELPAFDSARSDEPDAVVTDWRAEVEHADAVLVAAPEYAGGLAGAVKNTLDWLVATGAVYRTPVAVISAGTTGGPHALVGAGADPDLAGRLRGGRARHRRAADEVRCAGALHGRPTLAAIRALTGELLGAASAPSAEVAATATRVMGGGDRTRARPPPA